MDCGPRELTTKLYSYVVQHDTGHAPNPYFGVCTLCRCKYRKSPNGRRNIVELAKEGDWVVGTGGADKRKSAGHGKLIYAMRVDEKLTREEYYADRRFAKKRPVEQGTYAKRQGDNVRPGSFFKKHEQFALISLHFYYFGARAIHIPKKMFPQLEKRGPGFRADFDEPKRLVKWLERHYKRGKYGEPCQRPAATPEGTKSCKSSC